MVDNKAVIYLQDVIYIILLAPLNEGVEHEKCLVHFKFSGSEESQEIVVIVLRVISDVVLFNVLLELF
jgi:hypothetical protein